MNSAFYSVLETSWLAHSFFLAVLPLENSISQVKQNKDCSRQSSHWGFTLLHTLNSQKKVFCWGWPPSKIPRVPLQLGWGKRKSVGTISTSQCTHISCTSITILVRFKNFLLQYDCIPKNPLMSIINMNVSHNVYPTFHVHWAKSCWCNKNRTTFTTGINLNSVFTVLCRPSSLFWCCSLGFKLYKTSYSKLENTWLTLAELWATDARVGLTPTRAWRVPGHTCCHSQTRCFTESIRLEKIPRSSSSPYDQTPRSTRPRH